MASSFELKVIGLDKLTKKLEQIPVEIQDGLDRAFQQASKDWENGAVRDAPVYDGKLRGSITSARVGFLHYRISAGVFYAPFVEFGTKKRVQIPRGLEAVAAKYRGGGRRGNFKDLLESIEKWVRKKKIRTVGGEKAASVYSQGRNRRVKRRKGTYSAAAYWIALNIVKNGIKPQPYFFKQKQQAVNTISREVAQIYKRVRL
ncbi:Bacteriophage HK97-gp10, putative tail-component [uncultured Caudovirales phage]|uniref:Bacteriophage HK97-gp10, putative tail-component n=1 Tax=uncultured Caudovirales phage TaxID=2100421 RepID=A0A6J5M0C1_9CAUD|nr:Bacteriophage HK97-gp10, putative tail-component [uncultured Caudovirales phage]